ncbi:MAG TPA: hypothetical protein VNJ53_09440 [Gaiellaceae bacterium]|nr:hypothetical protein [Gaiellaceae bacterium]
MAQRRLALLSAALVLAGAIAGAGQGAGSAARPPGSPDLAAMALAVGDFPAGTRVDSQGWKRDPDFVGSYERDFDVRGLRLGRSRVLAAFQTLDLERTPADAKLTFDLAAELFRGKQGAQLLKAALVSEGFSPKSISVAPTRRPRIGDGALVLALRLTQEGVRFGFTVSLLRFDRVLLGVGLISFPGSSLHKADVDRLSRVAVERVRAGLVPVAAAPPVLSGTAQPGQTLTAAGGTWTGDGVALTYQWERCLAAVVGCVPIAGATGPTYVVATGDLASVLRISVTGRNRLGATTASSAASGQVAGPPGSPTALAPPAINGTFQVGTTVFATTGSWSGEPTAFAFQWRRCDASERCVDIAGATASSYTLAPEDARSSLRVLVVATNSAGAGGSLSPPSPAIP